MKSYERLYPPTALAELQDLIKQLSIHWETLSTGTRRNVIESTKVYLERMLNEEV